MGVIEFRFPRTSVGKRLAKDALAACGFREVYPDGSTLATTDWDTLAAQVEAEWNSYVAFCAERERIR